jgi:hypothetical protein
MLTILGISVIPMKNPNYFFGAVLVIVGLATMLGGILFHAKRPGDATACCISFPIVGLSCWTHPPV